MFSNQFSERQYFTIINRTLKQYVNTAIFLISKDLLNYIDHSSPFLQTRHLFSGITKGHLGGINTTIGILQKSIMEALIRRYDSLRQYDGWHYFNDITLCVNMMDGIILMI